MSRLQYHARRPMGTSHIRSCSAAKAGKCGGRGERAAKYTCPGHDALQYIKQRSLQSDQGAWHLPAGPKSAPTVEISRRSSKSQGIMKIKAYERGLSSAA